MSKFVAEVEPFALDSLNNVTFELVAEVLRQDDLAREGKFRDTHVMPGGTDLERLAVLAEEFGEVSIEVCKGIMLDGQIRRPNLREELKQTAAVCLAWIAAIDEGREP